MFWSSLGDFGFENDPWFGSAAQNLRRLQDEMNRIFEGASSRGSTGFPAVNVWSNSEEALVTMEVPGMTADAINLSVTGNMLTVNGERLHDECVQKDKLIRRERGSGKFSRSIELPFPVNSDSVDAQYRNGVLKVVLARAEADKPKRITIK